MLVRSFPLPREPGCLLRASVARAAQPCWKSATCFRKMLAALAGICYAMPLQPENMGNAHGVGRGGSVLRSHETEQSLDDSRNHTKKLKSKYTGCRWENDVHCGGTAAFPGASGGDAPPTKAEAAAAKKQE